MSKKYKKRDPARGINTQMLRGGKALPRKLVQQCVTDLRKNRESQIDKRSSAEQTLTKHFRLAQDLAKPAAGSARADRAQNSLLKAHEKLSKLKLAIPNVLDGIGPLLPGQISATVTPPFDYDIKIPTVLAGNPPTLQGSTDKNTGKMSLSALTNTARGFNGGSMYTTVGIYFHPPGRGTLTMSAAPKYSFQWWTNSLRPTDLVRSFGQLGLTVYGVDVAGQTVGQLGTIEATAGAEFFSWDETQSGQVHLDCGFDVQTGVVSAQLNVNRNLVYLLFVDADVHVEGVGWPGSVAGAKLTVNVPYIKYDFLAEQVIQPV